MSTTTIYFVITAISFTLGYFYCKSVYNKEINRLKRFNQAKSIPFDDYARYQKAYVEFYKWIDHYNKIIKGRNQRHIVKTVIDKLEELFNDKNQTP